MAWGPLTRAWGASVPGARGGGQGTWQGLAEATKGLAWASQGLALTSQGLAWNSKDLTLASQGLA